MIHEFHGIPKMQPSPDAGFVRHPHPKYICQPETCSRIIKESCTKFHSHVQPEGNPQVEQVGIV